MPPDQLCRLNRSKKEDVTVSLKRLEKTLEKKLGGKPTAKMARKGFKKGHDGSGGDIKVSPWEERRKALYDW